MCAICQKSLASQGLPAFLPIGLESVRLGQIPEWFRELSWDKSWQNLLGEEDGGKRPSGRGRGQENAIVLSWHDVDHEEMSQLHLS